MRTLSPTFSAIRPTRTPEGSLFSPQLETKLHGNTNGEGYLASEQQNWQDFLVAAPGSLEELVLGRDLASLYLLQNAQKIQKDGVDKATWSERFTVASEALYGLVDKDEAGKMLSEQLSSLMSVESADLLVLEAKERFMRFAGKVPVRELSTTGAVGETLSLEQKKLIKEAILEIHSPIVAVLEAVGEGPYKSAQIREMISKMIPIYGEKQPEWLRWTVTNTKGKKNMSILRAKREIDIPDDRPDVATKIELQGLLFHELGVHSYRAAMGHAAQDEMLTLGLPQYLDFEEGLGAFIELLMSGEIDNKVVDRYVDVALALGPLTDTPVGMQELEQFVIDRQVLRDAREGKAIDLEFIRSEAEIHVDRIFRGGDGRAHKKAGGEISQAIFVKDIVNYEGLIKVQKYFAEQLAAGRSPSEIWHYLLMGKFDPTIEVHRRYVSEKMGV